MTSSDKELDRALSGRTTSDQDTAEMVDVARRLEGTFDVEAPRADAQKALFAAAVGTRRRPSAWRYLAPAVAMGSLLVAVYFAGRAATPGNAFYPVRKALQQVDLAPQVGEQVDTVLQGARLKIVQAEARFEDAPNRSVDLAAAALKELGRVESMIANLPSEDRAGPQEQVDVLEDRALAVMLAAFEEDEPEELEDAVDDLEDRSGSSEGPGSDDPASGSDNSGSGSDDSGSDDSGSDDNSGSGSDDNSGSGSDSSGSGSGGSDDSSGSGSGDDD